MVGTALKVAEGRDTCIPRQSKGGGERAERAEKAEAVERHEQPKSLERHIHTAAELQHLYWPDMSVG